jgi:hypothetical protein
MLHEFSDKVPQGKPKLTFMRGEFWLGAIAIFIGSALVLGLFI